MSVSDTGKVDAFTPGNPGEAILFVFDHLDWDNPGEHLHLLQEKINAYLAFIESGQYKELAPGQTFDKFVIRVTSLHKPPDSVGGYLDAAAKQIEQFGVRLEIEPSN